jgi:hypothetical protein
MRVLLLAAVAVLAAVLFGPFGLATVAFAGALSVLARGAFEAQAAHSMMRW